MQRKNYNVVKTREWFYKYAIEELEEAKATLKTLERLERKYLDTLKKVKKEINKDSNFKFKQVVELKDANKFVFIHDIDYDGDFIKAYVHKYVKAKEDIVYFKNLIETKEKKIKTIKQFRFIVGTCNELLIDKIINDGFVFSHGTFGKLGIRIVKKNPNHKLRIDWGETTKAKKKLLEEGKIPYSKKDAAEAEEKGEEYHGVKYIKYFDKPMDFMVFWVSCLNKNASIYKFKPTESSTPSNGKIPFIKKLRLAEAANKELYLKYYNNFKHGIQI